MKTPSDFIGKIADNTQAPIPEVPSGEGTLAADGKIAVHSIILVGNTINYYEGASAFAEADKNLSHRAGLVGNDGSYNKIDFIVRYTDSNVYEGRYDLYHYSENRNESLQQHILNHLRFNAGLRCPAKWTMEQYDGFLSVFPQRKEIYTQWLEKYAIM